MKEKTEIKRLVKTFQKARIRRIDKEAIPGMKTGSYFVPLAIKVYQSGEFLKSLNRVVCRNLP